MQKYNEVKNGWVSFKNGKPKIKLRKLVAERAKLLAQVNDFSFLENKNALIAEFNDKGLEGIQKVMTTELNEYKKRVEREKKRIKKQIKENHER